MVLSCSREVQVGYKEIFLWKDCKGLEQAAQEVVESSFLERLKTHGAHISQHKHVSTSPDPCY